LVDSWETWVAMVVAVSIRRDWTTIIIGFREKASQGRVDGESDGTKRTEFRAKGTGHRHKSRFA